MSERWLVYRRQLKGLARRPGWVLVSEHATEAAANRAAIALGGDTWVRRGRDRHGDAPAASLAASGDAETASGSD